MKALTDAELLSFFDEELVWRRVELQALKAHLRSFGSNPNSPAARAAARALAVLTYSHWEGYVKATFDKIAQAVSRRKPLLSSVADDFAVAHLRHLLTRLNSGDAGAKQDLLEIARGSTGVRVALKRDELVRTHDNLRYRFLKEILAGFGMDWSDFELHEHFINSKLCDRRNEVAHGLGAFPQADDALSAADEVLTLLEALRDIQGAFVSSRSYLRA